MAFPFPHRIRALWKTSKMFKYSVIGATLIGATANIGTLATVSLTTVLSGAITGAGVGIILPYLGGVLWGFFFSGQWKYIRFVQFVSAYVEKTDDALEARVDAVANRYKEELAQANIFEKSVYGIWYVLTAMRILFRLPAGLLNLSLIAHF